jgi:hypothetical protein
VGTGISVAVTFNSNGVFVAPISLTDMVNVGKEESIVGVDGAG